MNLTKPSSHQNNNNQNSHQQLQHKSALVAADSKSKFSEIRLARKTSFLIPPCQGEESDVENNGADDDEKESSDYISDFPEFKKAINSHRAAYIDLKKRKSSSSSQIGSGGAKLFTTGDSFDSVTNTMTKLPKSSQKRDNSNDDMHKNSKFRPTTPKVLFNYFPVTFISSKSKDSSNNVLLTKRMNSVNHFSMGNTSAESNINRESQISGGERLPKINPAIKENLLSSRTHAKILNKTDDKQQQQQQKQHKNLFFPLLINNNTNSSTSLSSGSNKSRNENKSIVSNLNSYFDDPNGIFFLQSLSHLSMKNLNQT